MRSVAVDTLSPSMVVGRHIYSSHGQLLLGRGVTLTTDLIERIKRVGIRQVFVDDPDTEGIETEDAVPHEVRASAVGLVQDTFEHLCSQPNISTMHLNADLFTSLAKDILDGLREHPRHVYNVISIKTYDEYTYQHSANVAILAMILGRSMQLTEEELIHLGVGALLHDLGKIQIPLSILNKPGRLDPEEFVVMKQHARLGFDVLKKDWAISPLSSNVALSHHERIDGTGYPAQRKGDEIHLYSKITAAADIYDALTSDRPYRRPMSSDGAMRLLLQETYDRLDRTPVSVLSHSIAPYPIGFGALLSNRWAGIISQMNEDDPFLPTVRLMFGPGGFKIDRPCEFETARGGGVTIVEVTPDGSAENLARMAAAAKAA